MGYLQIGHCMLPNELSNNSFPDKQLSILFNHRSVLQHTMRCVNENWPILLVGQNNCGKTSFIHLLTKLTNHRLHEFAMTPENRWNYWAVLNRLMCWDIYAHLFRENIWQGMLTKMCVILNKKVFKKWRVWPGLRYRDELYDLCLYYKLHSVFKYYISIFIIDISCVILIIYDSFFSVGVSLCFILG